MDQSWFVAQKMSAERGTADTIVETGHPRRPAGGPADR